MYDRGMGWNSIYEAELPGASQTHIHNRMREGEMNLEELFQKGRIMILSPQTLPTTTGQFY